MPQYVYQFQVAPNCVNVGWLAKCFEVSPQYPIPTEWPDTRIQEVGTNTATFEAVTAVYNQYHQDAIFSYDEPTETINCTGAYTGSWPKD